MGVSRCPSVPMPRCPLQLPYFIDGPVKLTQSNAILRYIAHKHNMCEWGARSGAGVGLELGLELDWCSVGLGLELD